MTIADSMANEFYPDPRTLGRALAEALNAEVRSLAAGGLPPHPGRRAGLRPQARSRLWSTVSSTSMRVFHGVPDEVQRIVHMCCGYPSALDAPDYPTADPQAYFRIADAMDQACGRRGLHRGRASSERPEPARALCPNTTVLLGVVNIGASPVEPVDEIAERLGQALQHIDRARLVAAPDCGLGLLGRELAVAKLTNLCAAAHGVACG